MRTTQNVESRGPGGAVTWPACTPCLCVLADQSTLRLEMPGGAGRGRGRGGCKALAAGASSHARAEANDPGGAFHRTGPLADPPSRGATGLRGGCSNGLPDAVRWH